jgi:hypothetical protein
LKLNNSTLIAIAWSHNIICTIQYNIVTVAWAGGRGGEIGPHPTNIFKSVILIKKNDQKAIK